MLQIEILSFPQGKKNGLFTASRGKTENVRANRSIAASTSV
jgi:hypothetical protein